MNVIKEGKNFFSVELAQNEVFDRNFYSKGMGLGKAVVIYYEGAGGLEFSADEVTWIASGVNELVLFSNDSQYPQYLRGTGAGTTTVHFSLK